MPFHTRYVDQRAEFDSEVCSGMGISFKICSLSSFGLLFQKENIGKRQGLLEACQCISPMLEQMVGSTTGLIFIPNDWQHNEACGNDQPNVDCGKIFRVELPSASQLPKTPFCPHFRYPASLLHCSMTFHSPFLCSIPQYAWSCWIF